MIPVWLPLFALLAGVAALARRPVATPQTVGAGASGCAISPIAVMNECLRRGARPPQIVIECAIAEARLIGRHDLAAQLVETFMAPMIPAPQAQAQAPQPAQQATPAPAQQAQPAAPLPPGVIAFRMPDEDGAAAKGMPIQTAAPLPIPGIDHHAWSTFRSALEREAPTFATKRHVGRYRQNRERLAELGLDPDVVATSVEAQDAALAADVADAYRHVADPDGLGYYVGQPVAIPRAPDAPDDDAIDVPVTLSGVLGVANVAGLEGAAEWLENRGDRKRFPHTTAAFLRTNGVF